MRTAAERVEGRGLAVAAVAAAAAFCALFFSGGYDDAPLVWIGAIALVGAGLAASSAAVGLLPAPRLDRPAAGFLACLVGLATWMGVTTIWSTSPDRSWATTNRTLVYAAFAVLGALAVAGMRRPATWLARAAAALLALLLGWALLAKCVPGLYPGYGLQAGLDPSLAVARLRAPVGYWNELALLADAAVPAGLWLAAPRARPAATRAAGVLLLYVATLTVLLTYSRVGVVLAVAAALGWTLLDRDRVESLAASLLAGGAGAAAFGVALALPGITKDAQPRSVRAHDGWVFALVVLGLGAAVAAVALVLARREAARPLAPERRRTFERAAGLAAGAVALAGLAVAIAFAGRLWHEFANPLGSQIASSSGHLSSISSSNRWRWWQEQWHAFTGHPLGGTGAGTFQLTDLRLRQTHLLTTVEPHNVPLQLLGETGVVGFLLYLGAAAAAAVAIVRARRRADGEERAAVTALGIVLAAFLAHTVVDMDWNYVATCGPLLLLAGALVVRPAAGERVASRRPVLALGAVLVALAAVYSLAAPWLAQRRLAAAGNAVLTDVKGAVADAKQAHAYDPLSTEALTDWAAYVDLAGDPLKAEDIYRQAVSLEPENAETWLALGHFYADHGAWRLAYEAYSKAYSYDSQGEAGIPCGPLDQARHHALGVWAPNCPRGRPRAATP